MHSVHLMLLFFLDIKRQYAFISKTVLIQIVSFQTSYSHSGCTAHQQITSSNYSPERTRLVKYLCYKVMENSVTCRALKPLFSSHLANSHKQFLQIKRGLLMFTLGDLSSQTLSGHFVGHIMVFKNPSNIASRDRFLPV